MYDKNKKTIMVVDDEEKIRYVVRKILEGKGYEVIDADGGRYAPEKGQPGVRKNRHHIQYTHNRNRQEIQTHQKNQ